MLFVQYELSWMHCQCPISTLHIHLLDLELEVYLVQEYPHSQQANLLHLCHRTPVVSTQEATRTTAIVTDVALTLRKFLAVLSHAIPPQLHTIIKTTTTNRMQTMIPTPILNLLSPIHILTHLPTSTTLHDLILRVRLQQRSPKAHLKPLRLDCYPCDT